MKKFDTFILLTEKSSLTSLGVPSEVMREIQYNYELRPDAKWERITTKKELKNELSKKEKAFYIEIGTKCVKVFINLGNKEYIFQHFTYDDTGWGRYITNERQYMSLTKLLSYINIKNKVYKLVGDDFQERLKSQRLIQKEIKKLDEETSEFKLHILENFNKILQRIYGRRYEVVMKKIAENIANFNPNADLDEIYKFLRDNKKLAEKAKEYEQAKNEEDMLRIKKLEKQYNSLPILDEYLINFEVGYSEKYGTRLNIHDLIKFFGRMMVETAFMYYLYTGRLMDMKMERIKLVQLYKKKKMFQ